jgi:hypothetical protein
MHTTATAKYSFEMPDALEATIGIVKATHGLPVLE